MTSLENIIVTLVVLSAAAYAARRVFFRIRAMFTNTLASDQACGHGGCARCPRSEVETR